ncbi:MAG: NUDIX domain-containing protein [Lentimicrobiaceae bacterium]|nr:NUDIX domain-containing protein [Lentimicrobiaceae bacterium]
MQRYSFFYNSARLLIAKHEHNHQTKTQTENCFTFNISLDLTDIFSKFLSSEQNFDLFYANETEENQIKNVLHDFFIFERAAGGIVFKNDAILTIFRLNRWDFPKGHIEAGETDTAAALREVTEETGIDELTIEKDLHYTRHIYKNENDRFVLKETHWYQMQTASEKVLCPQTEENILTAKWIPFSQRNRIIENTYPSIVELLGRV